MAAFTKENLVRIKKLHREKFQPLVDVFKNIRKGSVIFIGTGCGQPQYLVQALTDFTDNYPNDLFGAEIIHVLTLGIASYIDEQYKTHFRHNSFYISDSSREAVNRCDADYTPVFHSEVPELLKKKIIDIDVALIQVSLPDEDGNVSLGISVDIAKTAVGNAKLVIAQVNAHMPVTGEDSLINISGIDYLYHRDEQLLEFTPKVPDDIAKLIGRFVAKIIRDGDTLQIGYGRMPNAVLKYLDEKKDLGIHTEMLTDGVVGLMKSGVVTNSRKNRDTGKTVATFCMGSKKTYKYLNKNPDIDFRPVDYTNNPRVISSINSMVAINSALQVDLSGQATAESIGTFLYSGVGGQPDFMRNAVKSIEGTSILAIRSTSNDGRHSRIVPCLTEGAGITLTRGDIHYVVTEYGIAYLHAKNLRERSLSLIRIAHPAFRQELFDKAKELGYIYKDQEFVPGKKGEYPDHLETYKTMKNGDTLFLRPIRISDEDILKEFFYSLSDKSIYFRFFASRPHIPHRLLQKFVVIDYTQEIIILAIKMIEEREIVIGMGQYVIDEKTMFADVAFAVRDDHHNLGIGTILLDYMSTIAQKEGVHGFTADVLPDNKTMQHLLEKTGYTIDKKIDGISYHYTVPFTE